MRALLTLLAIVSSLALAACGGGSSGATPSDTASFETTTNSSQDAQAAVAAAAEKTHEAGSARMSFTAKITGGAASGTMSGEGAFSDNKGRLSMDLSGLGGAALSGRIDMLVNGLVFYMKFPPELSSQLPPGKRWVKFDLAKIGNQQGIDLQQLMQLGAADPSQTLELLTAASPDFREVGHEDVRGTPTTHYAGTIDFSKLAEKGPQSLRESYRRIIQLSGERKVPMDVWIGNDGLTRRISYSQALPGGATMEQTQEYYDFGVNVDIEPPPASQVLDVTATAGNS